MRLPDCSRAAKSLLRQAEPQKADRYGRVVAYAFTARDGVERSVQADLIAAGPARVAARAGNRACAVELLSRGNTARRRQAWPLGQFVL
jgi:endonuclease YncB( thermonuclease family)